MKLKLIILFFFVTLIPILSWSAVGPVVNYTSIGSDYGPRSDPRLDFHHGIDYAVSANSIVKAIVTANVISIQISANDNWVLTSSIPRSYRYGHLPNSGSNGTTNYSIKHSTGVNVDYILISAGTTHTIITTKNLTSTEKNQIRNENNIADADTINSTTQITEGNTFYVTGSQYMHVALGRDIDEPSNPLRYIPRNEQGSPKAVSFVNPSSIINNDTIFIAEVDTKRDYDLNKIEFFYREKGASNWTSIDYIEFEPKNNIKDPDYNTGHGINAFYPNTPIGSWPINNGTDEFHCNFSIQNLNDGGYEIQAVATDIANNSTDTVHEFTIGIDSNTVIINEEYPRSGQTIYESTPTLKFKVQSGADIDIDKMVVSLDDYIIPNSKLIFDPADNAATVDVSYKVADELDEGPYYLKIEAENINGVKKTNTVDFRVLYIGDDSMLISTNTYQPLVKMKIHSDKYLTAPELYNANDLTFTVNQMPSPYLWSILNTTTTNSVVHTIGIKVVDENLSPGSHTFEIQSEGDVYTNTFSVPNYPDQKANVNTITTAYNYIEQKIGGVTYEWMGGNDVYLEKNEMNWGYISSILNVNWKYRGQNINSTYTLTMDSNDGIGVISGKLYDTPNDSIILNQLDWDIEYWKAFWSGPPVPENAVINQAVIHTEYGVFTELYGEERGIIGEEDITDQIKNYFSGHKDNTPPLIGRNMKTARAGSGSGSTYIPVFEKDNRIIVSDNLIFNAADVIETNFSGVNSCRVISGVGSYSTTSSTFSFSNIPGGAHTITVEAEDANSNTATETFYIFKDDIPPEVMLYSEQITEDKKISFNLFTHDVHSPLEQIYFYIRYTDPVMYPNSTDDYISQTYEEGTDIYNSNNGLFRIKVEPTQNEEQLKNFTITIEDSSGGKPPVGTYWLEAKVYDIFRNGNLVERRIDMPRDDVYWYKFTTPSSEGILMDISATSPEQVYQGDSAAVEGECWSGLGRTISTVRYRIDGKSWQTVPALDGSYNSESESFSFSTDNLELGKHILDIEGVNSSGETAVYSAIIEVVPKPATFEVSDLEVNPDKTYIGESVKLSAKVENIGDLEGVYSAEFYIDSSTLLAEEITLPGGSTSTVSALYSSDIPGEYLVTVMDSTETASFSLYEPPTVKNLTATDIAYSSAVLQAQLTEVGLEPGVTTYFRYRKTGDSEWVSTSPEMLISTGIFSRKIEGLTPFTEYEFHAVWTYGDRTLYGNNKLLKTHKGLVPAGSGTESDPYQVASIEHLDWMRNELSAHYILVDNIDATKINPNDPYFDPEGIWGDGKGFNPVGDYYNPFTGTVDGQGYEISNLYINDSDLEKAFGLFGVMDNGGEIKNIHLREVDITVSGRDVGSLLGLNRKGTIENSSVTGNINEMSGENDPVGGLVGALHTLYSADKANIINSYSEAKVYSNGGTVGGLVGRISGSNSIVTVSYATGSVTGGFGKVGGLAGSCRSGGRIYNSYATGNVESSDSLVGGLLGYGGGVYSSYATGNVEGYYYVGGLVGQGSGKIYGSYATGSVVGNNSVGGLVGWYASGNITSSYATGNVSGYGRIGGLVGYNSENINGSFATGIVAGTNEVGALVGRSRYGGYVRYSYANSDHNSNLDLVGYDAGTVIGSGLRTTEEMTDHMNGYPNAYSYVRLWLLGRPPLWDFENTWQSTNWNKDGEGNSGYPALVWQGDFPTVRTLEATNIGYSSATLHGELTRAGLKPGVTTYFRYRIKGSTEWAQSSYHYLSSTGPFESAVTEMASNTIYQFQALVTWSGYESASSILEFQTELTPAEFVINKLTVNPAEVYVNGQPTFTATVENIGETEGTYSTEFYISGSTLTAEDVIFPALSTAAVSVVYSTDTAGEYNVSVMDSTETVNITVYNPPSVVTSTVEDVTYSSAAFHGQLTGIVLHPGVTTYFLYRTQNAVEWSSTTPQILTATGTFSDTVEDLISNTTYQFKAVASWGVGESTGSILKFQTDPSPPEFVVSNLAVNPAELYINEQTTFSVTIENVGETEGTYSTEFYVSGSTLTAEDVIVPALSTAAASIVYSPDTAGEYNVSVMDSTETVNITVYNPPSVVTSTATDITHTSTLFKGTLTDMSLEPGVTTYFRYRLQSETEWVATAKQYMTSTGAFANSVQGLQPSSVYEFKAVVSWDGKEEVGDIITFTTESNFLVNEFFNEWNDTPENWEWGETLSRIDKEGYNPLVGDYNVALTPIGSHNTLEQYFTGVASSTYYGEIWARGTGGVRVRLGIRRDGHNQYGAYVALEDNTWTKVSYTRDSQGGSDDGMIISILESEDGQRPPVTVGAAWMGVHGPPADWPPAFPVVESAPATDIVWSSATLQGELTSTGLEPGTTAYFLYRTEGTSEWEQTGYRYLTGAGPFETIITGLNSNTVYQYQAAIMWGTQISTGSVLEFRTEPTPAEFVVSGLEINPAENYVNGQTTFSATIENIGESEGSYSAEFYISGATLTADTTVPGLSSAAVNVIYSTDIAGTYTVTLKDAPEEEKTFTVYDYPSVVSDPAADITHSSAALYGQLDNIGLEPGVTTYFRYRLQGATEWSATPPQILTATGTFSAIVEGLESNTTYQFQSAVQWGGTEVTGNILSFTTLLSPPVFTASSMRVYPNIVYIGKEVNLRVDIENSGELAGDYTVDFYVNSGYEGSDTVTVAGGQTETAQIKYQTYTADTYSAQAEGLSSEFEVYNRPTYPDIIKYRLTDWRDSFTEPIDDENDYRLTVGNAEVYQKDEHMVMQAGEPLQDGWGIAAMRRGYNTTMHNVIRTVNKVVDAGPRSAFTAGFSLVDKTDTSYGDNYLYFRKDDSDRGNIYLRYRQKRSDNITEIELKNNVWGEGDLIDVVFTHKGNTSEYWVFVNGIEVLQESRVTYAYPDERFYPTTGVWSSEPKLTEIWVDELEVYDFPSADTREAENITHSSATIRGELTNMGNQNEVSIYFYYRKYGDSTWIQTPSQTMSSTGDFNHTIYGLNSDTTYQFKAATAWNSDEVLGNTFTFRTELSPPEFVVSGLEINPAEIYVNGQSTFTTTVENIGESEGSYSAEFYVSGTTLTADSVLLSGLSATSGSVVYISSGAGTHEVAVKDSMESKTLFVHDYPSAVTEPASGITYSSATLHGEIAGIGLEPGVTVYFHHRVRGDVEWIQTSSQYMTKAGTFSQTIDGLWPGKIYEVKTALQWDEGADAGEILSFRAKRNFLVNEFFEDWNNDTPLGWVPVNEDQYKSTQSLVGFYSMGIEHGYVGDRDIEQAVSWPTVEGEEITYSGQIRVKGSGFVRVGIRRPGYTYYNYGDWKRLDEDEWTEIKHIVAGDKAGSQVELRIQTTSRKGAPGDEVIDVDLHVGAAWLGIEPAYPGWPHTELLLSSLNLSPDEIYVSESSTFSVNVENIGTEEAAYTAVFYVDEVESGSDTVIVPAGETKTAAIFYSTISAGEYTVRVGTIQKTLIVLDEGAGASSVGDFYYAEFKLGDIYSFPNPAKGGKDPTIHFECGIADRVEIRIYNIAAELVHAKEISGSPQIINGKYAYEYTWDTSGIASGVYIYHVRAVKDGQELVVTKKLAVIK